jgi:malate dehydrogenase
MFGRRVSNAARSLTRSYKVMVCGGSGGIGQPMAMLMSLDSRVTSLVVMDVSMAMVPPEGVACDLSHIEKPCKVEGVAVDPSKPATDQLKAQLTGCDLVLIPAGVPRKPGMTRDDLFNINAGIAKGIVEACATHCPNAVLGLIVNPVNSVVPAMADLYKKKGLDPRKIVGVTTLDVVRANKFVAQATGADVTGVDVPVVGGHAGVTILPLFSQMTGTPPIPSADVPALDVRVQDAGTEVVNAKSGKGSATLSMAYAGARLGKAVLDGLEGKGTIECAYVAMLGDDKKIVGTDLDYFSTKVKFGKKGGVEEVYPIGPLNEHETARMKEVNAALSAEIAKGVEWVATQ